MYVEEKDIHYYTKAKYEMLPWEAGRVYEVMEDFVYYSKRYNKHITVRKGFTHDKYTFVPDLPDETPSIVHDYLYRYKKFDDGTKCTRWMADNIFRDMMNEAGGVTKFFSMLYFLGVTIFGIFPWKM